MTLVDNPGSYAVLRFQVHIPENYPDGDVPKVVFEHHVFHPCIDPNTHQLNVKQVCCARFIKII